MRVAVYARVSTYSGQSPEMQLTELREYASRRGWQLSNEFRHFAPLGHHWGYRSLHLKMCSSELTEARTFR